MRDCNKLTVLSVINALLFITYDGDFIVAKNICTAEDG